MGEMCIPFQLPFNDQGRTQFSKNHKCEKKEKRKGSLFMDINSVELPLSYEGYPRVIMS